ncbi:hypothetical protein GCM10027447_31900 [Glycomyces halotolerans]
MSDGFGADPEEIRDHASALRSNVFPKIENAATAAREVGLGGSEAYGYLMSPFINAIYDVFVDDAGAAIEDTAALAEAVGLSLDGIAMCYEDVDTEISDMLQKIAEEIE